VWRLTPGQTLLRHGWDGEYVLYNDLSGDTHLLNATACAVLQQLQDGPCAAATLGRTCALDADSLDVLLGDLELLTLVEYLPC
jgi:PqqD family protein of HPr-rel-A system